MRLRAFAKVNYALEVRGVRSDGYHDISTVLQSISLSDEVTLERTGRGFELTIEPDGVEIGPLEENTVYAARELLQEASGRRLPVRVLLRKNIPAGAGLGGGSADAAAMLVGLNSLFGLNFGEAKLQEIGLRIGADVPFCISGGTALGEGIGETLSPLPTPPPHNLVITKPSPGANTAQIYRAYDAVVGKSNAAVRPVVEALRKGDREALARSLGNDLGPVTKDLVPEVRALEEDLLDAGSLGAVMSGSGTAVLGVFVSAAEAQAATRKLGAPFVSVCDPVPHGVEIL